MKKRSLPFLACLVLAEVPLAARAQPVGREFRVNSYIGYQANPSISSDATGTFVVVWQSGKISDGGRGQDGSDGGIFGQRYDSEAGRRLGGEFQINTYTTGHQSRPSVSSSTDGRFIVTWSSDRQDGSSGSIFGQRYASDGSLLGDEFQVNTYTTAFQGNSSVASDADGNFVVVWAGAGNGDSYGAFGQRYDKDGIRLGGEFRVNSYTTGNQVEPKIATDPEGGFVVVWASRDQDGAGYGVFGRRFDSGGDPLGDEFQVNTHTEYFQEYPAIAFDETGRFVVVWEDYYIVKGQRYDSVGTRLGGEFQVSTEYPRYGNYGPPAPSVATTRDRGFSVVWNHALKLQGDFHFSKILGRPYDQDGNPLHGPFKVNEREIRTFGTEALIAGTGSRFVVVWTAFPPEANSYNVDGRRLALP